MIFIFWAHVADAQSQLTPDFEPDRITTSLLDACIPVRQNLVHDSSCMLGAAAELAHEVDIMHLMMRGHSH